MRERAYFVILISATFYFLLTFGISKEEKEGREDSVKVPKHLLKILFPHNEGDRMPLVILITALYLVISNVIVYGYYFYRCIVLKVEGEWKQINNTWILTTFGMMYLTLILTLGILMVKLKDRRVIKIVLFLFDIALIAVGVYYIVVPLFNKG